jgi:ribosomal protein L37AE/L43A
MRDCPECGSDAWCMIYEDDREIWECLHCEQIYIKPYQDDDFDY